MHTTTNACT